jgi:hypothetical protein
MHGEEADLINEDITQEIMGYIIFIYLLIELAFKNNITKKPSRCSILFYTLIIVYRLNEYCKLIK